MPMTFCPLPLPFVATAPDTVASNDSQLHIAATQMPAHGNVRMLRRAHEADNTRFVLSGKLSDVCAALEQLVNQEQRYATAV